MLQLNGLPNKIILSLICSVFKGLLYPLEQNASLVLVRHWVHLVSLCNNKWAILTSTATGFTHIQLFIATFLSVNVECTTVDVSSSDETWTMGTGEMLTGAHRNLKLFRKMLVDWLEAADNGILAG